MAILSSGLYAVHDVCTLALFQFTTFKTNDRMRESIQVILNNKYYDSISKAINFVIALFTKFVS